MLGLPNGITTCLFDLDGVLTKTAIVHSAAWSETFDEYLRLWAQETGEPFIAFSANDYNAYVDGKKRADGVRDFFASRGILLPEGRATDSPGTETVIGIGNRKNELLLSLIERNGVEVYEGSRQYVNAALAAGLHTGVVSSSANTEQVLNVTGLAASFQVRIDGVVAQEEDLPGKPAPDTFIAAARALGAEPAQAAVFEDALAGVAAGRAGGFGFVIGVDRAGQADALRSHGADLVVQDLAELL